MASTYFNKLIEVVSGKVERSFRAAQLPNAGQDNLLTGASGYQYNIYNLSIACRNDTGLDATLTILDASTPSNYYEREVPRRSVAVFDIDLQGGPWAITPEAALILDKSAALTKCQATVLYTKDAYP